MNRIGPTSIFNVPCSIFDIPSVSLEREKENQLADFTEGCTGVTAETLTRFGDTRKTRFESNQGVPLPCGGLFKLSKLISTSRRARDRDWVVNTGN